jgi:hypothetical protein
MRSTLSCLAALVTSAALAQAPAPPAAEVEARIQRYEVEIIVFANRNFDPTEERFDLAPNGFGDAAAAALREAPIFDETTFAPRESPRPPADQLAPVDPVAAARAEALVVRPLRPEELKLGPEYRKLEAIAAYEPLLHTGWVLPGLPEADSVPFDLKTLGVVNPRGTVRVHLLRYLHITLDLTYQATDTAASSLGSSDGLDEIVLAPQYRLMTTRRVTSGELHYFDHPAFGVLMRITPVPVQDGSGRRPAA